MTNTYWENSGKYQEQYNVLIRKSRLKNDMISSILNTACDLYFEYYQYQNMRMDNEWQKYMLKFDHLCYHIPSLQDIVDNIIDKADDNEISVEMEYLYESLMDVVLEYVMNNQPPQVNIRPNFKCEFDNISDLAKYPEYSYKLGITIQKGVKTSSEAMSLDELEKVAENILSFVYAERNKQH